MKEILTRYGEVTKICQLLGLSRPTVINALKGRRDDDLAKRVRTAAIKRGGVEVK